MTVTAMTPTAVDAGSVRSRTTAIAVGQSVAKGGQIVVAVMLVRLLAPQQWNTVAFLLSIHLAGVTFATLNLHQGVLYFANGPSPIRAVVGRTTLMMSVVGAVVALGLMVGADALGASTGSSRWIPWVGLAIALEVSTAAVPSTMISLGHHRIAATWDTTVTVVQAVAMIGPAAAGRGADGVIAGLLVAALFRVVLGIALVVRITSGPWRGLPAGWARRHLHYCVPLGLTLFVGVLNRSVDKWLVAVFRPDQVGVHAIAAQEIPLIAVLPYAGGAAIAVQLADSFRRGAVDEARDWWTVQTASMARILVPVTVLVIVAAPEALTTLFGVGAAAGVTAFRLFAAISLHRVAEYGLILRCAGSTRSLVSTALALLGLNLVCAAIGAYGWGATGAAAGTLVANIGAWLLMLGRIAEVLGTNRRGAFPWRTWGSALANAGLAASVALAVCEVVHRSSEVLDGAHASAVSLVLKVAVFLLVLRVSPAVTVGDGRRTNPMPTREALR